MPSSSSSSKFVFLYSRIPNTLVVFRIIGAKGKKEAMGYTSYAEFALGFYNEVVVHLPFISSVHNIWRAKQLFDLNFGFSNFRMRDSAKVEQILVAAGKGSNSESMYEAGPQSVTQVPHRS